MSQLQKRHSIRRLPDRLAWDALESAEGIVRIINVKMQEAIKAISTMRGHDLGDFMLLAFGVPAPPRRNDRKRARNGWSYRAALSRVYSAMGLVMSDVKHDHIRSRMTQLARTDEAGINLVFADLEARAREELQSEGFAEDRIRIEPSLDMRYAGQGYELNLPCPYPMQPGDIARLRTRFDETTRKCTAYCSWRAVEIVSWRLRGVGVVPPVELPRFERTGETLESARREIRKACFDGALIDCPVYQRESSMSALKYRGPPSSISLIAPP